MEILDWIRGVSENPSSWQYWAVSGVTLAVYSAILGFLFRGSDGPVEMGWPILFWGVLITLFWQVFWIFAAIALAVFMLIVVPVWIGNRLSKMVRK